MTRQRFAKRTLQAGLLSALLLLLSASWVHAQLQSELEKNALSFGSSLLDHIRLALGASATSRLPHTHRISLNGAEFEVQTLTIQGSPEAPFAHAFETFRSRCQDPRNQAPVTVPLEELREPLQRIGISPETPLIEHLVFESGDQKEHSAYCLRPAFELNLAGLVGMSRDFTESGDLNHLGTWQGLYARQEKDKQGTPRVALMSIEAQGSFNPLTLFPQDKDAPGADFQELPRPQGRRVLSLSYGPTPSLNSYALQTPLGASLEQYLKSATQAGLRVERPAESGTPGSALFIRTAQRSYLVTGIENAAGTTLLLAALPN